MKIYVRHHERPRCESIDARRVGLLICLCLVSLAATSASAYERVIGPGVAGQVHALAYDPTNASVIWAGGDNCGVVRSIDHGNSWERWNKGLSDDNLRMTSYVDDLLVVPPTDGVDPSAVGVYAATRGGIAFLPAGGSEWQVQTEDLNYRFGYAEEVGAAIPFCSLAFDPVSKRIYAGAGDGRIILPDRKVDYPEVPGVSDQYSLWWKSIEDSGVGPWTADTNLGNKSSTLQIAFVKSPNGTTRPVIATKEGIFLKDSRGNQWTAILDEQIMCGRFTCSYSHTAAGVAVGKNGVIWGLMKKDKLNDPGVYRLNPSVPIGQYYEYNTDWVQPGVDDTVPPQNGATWFDIVHAYGESDFLTLTVNPGGANSDDEVFVGMKSAKDQWTEYPSGPDTLTSYNGYFRYGECGDGVTRWVNILYMDGRSSWNHPDHPLVWADCSQTPITAQPINGDHGWVVGWHAYGSTVQLQVGPVEDPNDGDEYADWLFASMTQVPMVKEFGDAWEQRYCEFESGTPGMNGYYTTKGLNIMSVYGIDFTASHRMVVRCGDWLGFVTPPGDDDGSQGFLHMAPYNASGKLSTDTEIVGNDIYFARGGPRSEADNVTGLFGYSEASDGTRARQAIAIACYDSTLQGMGSTDSTGCSGYCWSYISQDLDDLFASADSFGVVDIEAVGPDTMFALVQDFETRSSMVSMGVLSGDPEMWSWNNWCDTGLGNAKHLLRIPGTDRLLVTSKSESCLLELSTTDNSVSMLTWLNHGDMDPGERLTRSLTNINSITCDNHGRWLYLTTCGQTASGPTQGDQERCANVLRVRIPEDGSIPAVADWDCLVNEGAAGAGINHIPYAAIDVEYWPDDWGQPSIHKASEHLPQIEAIEIHPDNPRHIFIGVRASGLKAGENYHPNNGVWEYIPSGDDGHWTQIKGQFGTQPCKGIRALGLRPSNPSEIVAGSFGEELFVVSTVGTSAPPVSGVIALEAMHPEQPLMMVTLDGVIGSIAEVRVDGANWGCAEPLALKDDGVAPDCEAGDGVWTVSLAGFTAQAFGELPLTVQVRDVNWNEYWGQVDVVVLNEVPEIYYRNDSRETDLDYAGTPTSIVSFDVPDGSGVVDGNRDLLQVQDGAAARLQKFRTLDGAPGDVPQYTLELTTFSSGQVPQPGHGGAVSADLNADGLEDLAIAAGHAGTFWIYLQNQTTNPRYSSLVLPAAVQDSLNTYSWSVACADYDLDGQLDLYVCCANPDAGERPGPGATPAGDVLLRNDMVNSGTFIDVTDEVISLPLGGSSLVTTRAAWCDYDGDGDPDLAVADGSTGSGLRILVNQNGLLTESAVLGPIGTLPVNNLSDLVWADLDGDGDQDLLAASFSSTESSYVFVNDGAGNLSSDQSLLQLSTEAPRAGIRVLDTDRDGYLDVLLLPQSDTDSPELLVNGLPETSGFDRMTKESGLGALTGQALTSVTTDLNGDGRADVLFGRAKAGNDFLCTAQGTGTPSWVGLRLFTADGAQHAAALGARVVVDLPGGHQQAMTLGGGGNGQTDQTILLGVDGSPGTVTCDITWPSGHTTNDTTLVLGQVNELVAPETFTLDTESVVGRLEQRPGGWIDYVFEWTTDYRTDIRQDKVVFDLLEICPLPALPDDHTLDHEVDGVTISQSRDTSSGTTVYRHVLRWENQPCYACSYPFWVQSGLGTTTSPTFDTILLRNRLCTTDDPDDPYNPPGGN